MTGMEEERRERLYGVRYEGSGDYPHAWGSHYTSPETARRQAEILTRKYGEGFFPVFVDIVTSVGRI
jgi:hypothetical protein